MEKPEFSRPRSWQSRAYRRLFNAEAETMMVRRMVRRAQANGEPSELIAADIVLGRGTLERRDACIGAGLIERDDKRAWLRVQLMHAMLDGLQSGALTDADLDATPPGRPARLISPISWNPPSTTGM